MTTHVLIVVAITSAGSGAKSVSQHRTAAACERARAAYERRYVGVLDQEGRDADRAVVCVSVKRTNKGDTK